MEIGERIRNRRIELSMTQEELAKRVGYSSKTTIAKIESNANQLRQSMIAKIAKALDVTPGYIMGWEDNLTAETGAMLADYVEDVELFSYMNKIKQASPEVRKKILSMIDLMLSE